MYQKIIVPLDGSDAAEIALPYAEEMAARTGAELALVSVSDPTREGEDNLYRSYLERVSEQVVSELKYWGAAVEAPV